MDRFFVRCAGFGFIRVSGFVFDAEVVPGDIDEPIPGLYGDNQLWNLFTAKNSARCGEDFPSGTARLPGASGHGFGYLFDGNPVVESA